MSNSAEHKQPHLYLKYTPNGKYHFESGEPESRGRNMSLDMTEAEVREQFRRLWPEEYSDSDIDEQMRKARERANVQP